MIDQNTEISGRMNLSDIPADMMAAANTVSDWMKRVGITHFMGVQLRDFLEDAPRESGSSMPPQVTTMTGILDRVAEPGSNQAIADALREHGGLDLLCAGVARLLEADAKNHDLLAAGEMKWRGLCEKAYLAMDAFTDPVGNMPEDTGEFRDLKAVMIEISRALGLAPALVGLDAWRQAMEGAALQQPWTAVIPTGEFPEPPPSAPVAP
jgi:hypothetical protein